MTSKENTWLTSVALAFCLAWAGAQPAAFAADEAEAGAASDAANQTLEDTNNTADSSDTITSTVTSGEGGGAPIVVIGKDVELRAGQTAEAVVVIGGSAKIHGRVREAVVAVGGDVEVDGEVGDAVVAVLGNIKAAPSAKIHGDAVAVGGEVDVAPGASVSRTQQGIQLPEMRGLRNWFIHCVLLLRPLSFKVGWVWLIAGAVFLFYLLIAAVFPRPVEVCANELMRRPATSFLVGLLTIFLIPFLVLLLAVTGVGLVVLPFLFAAIFIATIVGKVSFLEWLGFKIGRQFGNEPLQTPIPALVLGSVIILLLYLVPVVGLATFALTRVWALGAAVLAGLSGLKREIPEKPLPANPAADQPFSAAAPSGEFTSVPVAPAFADVAPGTTLNAIVPPQPPVAPAPEPPKTKPPLPSLGGAPATATAPVIPPLQPPLPEVVSYPNAGFWERMGAGFLDVVLVCVLSAWVGPLAPVVALAYFAGMWAWKQTTIGGIVLGLKVARADGGPMTFVVALVRGLAAGFSIFVLFLGFLWIAWDKEKQGWHDKIAGTVVLKTPRGTPLVCL
jgi:uncharacterized RDD family membrane protein YckC